MQDLCSCLQPRGLMETCNLGMEAEMYVRAFCPGRCCSASVCTSDSNKYPGALEKERDRACFYKPSCSGLD